MSYNSGASTAAAAAAAVAQAVKASGAIVKLEPTEFIKILNKIDSPLVVAAKGGFLNRKFRYLTSYKGLFFYSESSDRIQCPSKTEFILSEKIWIPG